MKTIVVCGSRTWTDARAIHDRLACFEQPIRVLHGNARGADLIAAVAAGQLGHYTRPFPADWKTHGKRAGPIRNRELLDQRPELVIAFWDGVSRGTRDMIGAASKRGIPVEVHRA